MYLVMTKGMGCPKSRNLSRRHMYTAPLLLPPAAIPGEIGLSLPPPSMSGKVPRDGEDCGKLGVEVYLWPAASRKCWLAATEIFQGKEPSGLHPGAICMIKGPSLCERSRGPTSLPLSLQHMSVLSKRVSGAGTKVPVGQTFPYSKGRGGKKRLETLTVSI